MSFYDRASRFPTPDHRATDYNSAFTAKCNKHHTRHFPKFCGKKSKGESLGLIRTHVLYIIIYKTIKHYLAISHLLSNAFSLTHIETIGVWPFSNYANRVLTKSYLVKNTWKTVELEKGLQACITPFSGIWEHRSRNKGFISSIIFLQLRWQIEQIVISQIFNLCIMFAYTKWGGRPTGLIPKV